MVVGRGHFALVVVGKRRLAVVVRRCPAVLRSEDDVLSCGRKTMSSSCDQKKTFHTCGGWKTMSSCCCDQKKTSHTCGGWKTMSSCCCGRKTMSCNCSQKIMSCNCRRQRTFVQEAVSLAAIGHPTGRRTILLSMDK